MVVGSWVTSVDEDMRVRWSPVGMGSVIGGGGISLWSSAQDVEYLENGGWALSTSSLMLLVISSD